MASKTAKYEGYANPAAHRAVIERALSNAAGVHSSIPARKRTRTDANRAAIKDQIN